MDLSPLISPQIQLLASGMWDAGKTVTPFALANETAKVFKMADPITRNGRMILGSLNFPPQTFPFIVKIENTATKYVNNEERWKDILADMVYDFQKNTLAVKNGDTARY
jgi:hypothetical protein